MRFSLHPGVWVGTIGLLLMGGIAMTQSTLPAQIATYRLGELAIVAAFLLFAWGIKWDGQHWWHLILTRATSPFPERHKQILQSLADALAEVQNLSLAKAYWNPQTHHALRQDHFSKLSDARTRAENLNEQIPYDSDTMQTVRDFLHAAQIVVHDGLQGWDDRESRSDLDRIAKGLFRYLHDGKAVNRRKIDLPEWCRNATEKAATSGEVPALLVEEERQEMPIWKAVEYVREIVGDDDFLNCYPKARRKIRQAALDGRLEITGRKEISSQSASAHNAAASSAWSKIEAVYWKDYELGPLSVGPLFEQQDHTWNDAHKTEVGQRYWELKVRESDMQRLWPTDHTR